MTPGDALLVPSTPSRVWSSPGDVLRGIRTGARFGAAAIVARLAMQLLPEWRIPLGTPRAFAVAMAAPLLAGVVAGALVGALWPWRRHPVTAIALGLAAGWIFAGGTPWTTCPCCGYPTFEQGNLPPHCVLCEWEQPAKGEEGELTLDEARSNFARFGTIYDPHQLPAWMPKPPSAAARSARKEMRAALEPMLWSGDRTRWLSCGVASTARGTRFAPPKPATSVHFQKNHDDGCLTVTRDCRRESGILRGPVHVRTLGGRRHATA